MDTPKPLSPSTYFDHQAKRADPNLLSDRAKRDALLLPEIRRVHKAYFEVYSVQKLWRELGREGFSIVGCADQVGTNLQGRMDSFATMASAAQGMTHASLERFARIDRGQASALGLENLTMETSPIMSQAPAALATLNAARAI